MHNPKDKRNSNSKNKLLGQVDTNGLNMFQAIILYINLNDTMFGPDGIA